MLTSTSILMKDKRKNINHLFREGVTAENAYPVIDVGYGAHRVGETDVYHSRRSLVNTFKIYKISYNIFIICLINNASSG